LPVGLQGGYLHQQWPSFFNKKASKKIAKELLEKLKAEKRNKKMPIIFFIIFILLASVFWFLGTYNQFIKITISLVNSTHL
jgi:predicted nucleic acid-binding Zn ribbon protein